MAENKQDNTDATSIRPVSSLRSHFETLLTAPSPAPTAPTSRNVSPQIAATSRFEGSERLDGRVSLDIPRSGGISRTRTPSPNRPAFEAHDPFVAESNKDKDIQTATPRQRPVSMLSFSPPRSPPKVLVDSPSSPPKFADLVSAFSAASTIRNLRTGSSRSGSPQPPSSVSSRNGRNISRATTPGLDIAQTPIFEASPPSSGVYSDPQKSSPIARSPAPPVNRAAKPKVPSKPLAIANQRTLSTTLAPDHGHDTGDEKISPFSTPPSSEGSPGFSPSPPRGREGRPSKNKNVMPSNFDNYFEQQLPNKAEKKPELPSQKRPASLGPSRTHAVPDIRSELGDLPEERPHLPPRRLPSAIDTRIETSIVKKREAPEPPPARRSMEAFSRPVPAQPPTPIAPPRRADTMAAGPSASSHSRPPQNIFTGRISSELRREPPPRPSGELRREIAPLPIREISRQTPAYDSDEEYSTPTSKNPPVLSDFPDTSQANRRPPLFPHGPHEIPTKYETKLFAVSGEYLCITGYVTRVWNILSNEMLLSLSHGETVKVTSLCFKPTQDPENEGRLLWLGTNIGEIHELDIKMKDIVLSKSNAHPRREIIKIYRQGSEMWTLDDDGKIQVWPADNTGTPSLSNTPYMFSRYPRGHSTSIVIDGCLWIASGKEIHVYRRSFDKQVFASMVKEVMSQPGVGDATAVAALPHQQDRVYFGHADGKVTIYSRKDYSCFGVVSVSLYKISSLVGVGEFLWAGYNTGMIYVYDTTTNPWKVKKDWHAHEQPIAGVVLDSTSVYKLGRLQVASLGHDGMVRMWDGMLTDDSLELDMQEHDTEYCDFRELEALFLTWNAGASKPTSLRHDERDANFFRDLLTTSSRNTPDLLVFGFQELVDLENKKVTAKSLFRMKKKDDSSEQEHMSHQYRAWRDYLARCLQDYIPHEQYTLLHSSSLVGLFTCAFVKASEKHNIRDVRAAEVKLGMGGLHGNKGALILRFILDDSSVCFFNCHLAAGQTQTVHRNNDITNILETSSLPAHIDSESRQDTFVGGGDGSMILDHEICILNGDLNYRIDSMTRDSVVRDVERGNLAKLLERDQLLLSRRKNPGFRLRAFNEAPITFPPTYKYDVGTDRYDTSEKKRSPAWCDRLLYRGKGRIRQLDYRRWEVRVSDHRPVSGLFHIRVKTVDQRRRLVVKEASLRRFEVVRERVFLDIKFDYLVNILGMVPKEAERLLKKG